MKKIVIVSPSLKVGGIERALTVLANYFSEKGHVITFVCCLKSKHLYQLNQNITIVEPNFERIGGFLNKVLFYPRLTSYLRKSIKSASPDVVLSYGDVFCSFVLLATLKLKIPVFISDRTSPDYQFKFPIPLLKKILYPTSKGFIAQTERAKKYKEIQFNGKLNIEVIPNAIRNVQLYPDIKRENTILFVGRFAWEKDPEILIRAFSQIKNITNWNLVMAGSGPLLNKMKELSKQLNITNKVIFLGEVSQIDEIFAKAKIYVLPSVLEGFPNALCEAMAAGLPSITFSSIPHESIISNFENGIVINERNSQSLANQIDNLINDDLLRNRIGENAKEIAQKLNQKHIGNQVLDFISK